MFDIDDRVFYVSGAHRTGESNPLLGTTYECPGSVIEVRGDSSVSVRWDNGERNSYNNGDLMYAHLVEGKAMNPNSAFRMKKRKLPF